MLPLHGVQQIFYQFAGLILANSAARLLLSLRENKDKGNTVADRLIDPRVSNVRISYFINQCQTFIRYFLIIFILFESLFTILVPKFSNGVVYRHHPAYDVVNPVIIVHDMTKKTIFTI